MNQIKQILDVANSKWAKMNLGATECIIRACELHQATFALSDGFGSGTVVVSDAQCIAVQYAAGCWTLKRN